MFVKMPSYEDLLNKSDLIDRSLMLPSSDIMSVTFQKKEGLAAVICIKYIIDQDVFYPVTEDAYIFIEKDGNYSIDESHLIVRCLGLAKTKAIQKHIIDILLKN
jgi:hypothetical protein